MTLRARNPEAVKPGKPKILISGESGIGKTFFALDWPKPYLLDTESGATRPQYQEKLIKSGGAYFGKEEGAQDFNTVVEECKTLATTKHGYQTSIIDSFSYSYMMEAADAELKGGSEYGRDKKEANKPTRQLMRWIEKMDMNVILICHSKAKWVGQGKERYQDGTTFDGYDKLEYILDLWIEILPGGKTFIVRKSRIDSLPKGSSFPLEYKRFAELYGEEIINAPVTPAEMATAEQLIIINNLVGALNIQEDQIEKWFKKVDVDEWAEMTSEQIQSLINMLEKKIVDMSTATAPKVEAKKKPVEKKGKK